MTFMFLFLLSPITYAVVSLSNEYKTDYPGKEIRLSIVSENFSNEIEIVIGDEWFAGNLSYHLPSRPKWIIEFKDKSLDTKIDGGIIYAEILRCSKDLPWSLWNDKTCWILHDWKTMKKIIILIPVYNDWDSLIKVIDEIDEIIKKFKDISFECLIVNDASSIESFKISKPSNIKSITILNMRVNKGHARCNAFG